MAKEYNEVIEILNYISKEDFNKIPKELYNALKANIDLNYNFKYDISKTLEEQGVSEEAKVIIALFFRDYWATDKQREKILAKEKYDKQKREEQLREKYNPDNIFKNNLGTQANIKNEEKTDLAIIEELYWYQKLYQKILKIFGRKK